MNLSYQQPTQPSEINEKVIWRSFLAGDHNALECIYNAFVKDMYHYGYQILADETLVKDGIQDVFTNLWSNRSNLSRNVSIKFYLLKALRRQLLKYVHNQPRLEPLSIEAENLMKVVDHEEQRILKESSRETDQQLTQVIRQLPDRQREVLYLVFYRELPYETVADILSIQLPSVYTLVWKTLRKLKKQLKRADLAILILLMIGVS